MTADARSRDREAFARALDDLERALEQNIARAEQMGRRITELREALASGRSLVEIVPSERTPLIVHLLTESSEALDEYGSRFRRAEARVLHREGMTMDQIARLFRVSRQRVSALLREP